VTWRERAGAACAPVDVRENAMQHRDITTGMRKTSRKFICRSNIVAQNHPPGIKFELMFCDVSAEGIFITREKSLLFNRFFSVKKFLRGVQK
jgi:hypothetical protein